MLSSSPIASSLLEHAADLDVDVLAARELAAQLVANGALVAILPDAADGVFVAQAGMAVGKRMRGQVIRGSAAAWDSRAADGRDRCG